jgi:hypothetical protein
VPATHRHVTESESLETLATMLVLTLVFIRASCLTVGAQLLPPAPPKPVNVTWPGALLLVVV